MALDRRVRPPSTPAPIAWPARISPSERVQSFWASKSLIPLGRLRRRRAEFLGFMNNVVAAFPDRELHVILDNLNSHKKNERWLKKHPKVHFHFIPTRSSWLNQIETWFSILQGQSLSDASFTAIEQLQEHIMLSSLPTMRQRSHSPGPRKKSTNGGSKTAVSLNSDSGY